MNPEFTKIYEASFLKYKFALADVNRNGLPTTPARWKRLFRWSYTVSHEILHKITKSQLQHINIDPAQSLVNRWF